ncbi:hypothetical protein P154DRAFT_571000 [Amniculicola lignicola CBS 123094]|uniref:Uncharacterized protein n=1 Tax=Amniculicola lignicola CBS 123094 TaxID=1392246 RepID=A0A6A5WV66_9PLEO|nr:hypothetical protein P154DRAFT_571000 [Amniculicola lignicola CBS 123094]
MEYGAAYLRATKDDDDDGSNMLSAQRSPSQYLPYRPEATHSRRSSASSMNDRSSWAISPVALQQSLPPLPFQNESAVNRGSGLFQSRAVLDAPYQEPVAWANSTNFRTSVRPESPKIERQDSALTMTATVDAIPPPRQYFRHPRHILEPWKTGVWVRFPWCGFGALIGIVLLTGLSAGILLAIKGTSTDSWRVGSALPQVYISVMDMLMNFLMFFALSNGLVTIFWRQLMNGTTLSTMHDTYESSSFWPALALVARFRFNLVAVACLLAATSAVRGPLFQRALTMDDNAQLSVRGSLDIKLAPYPVPEYFQSASDNSDTGNVYTAQFLKALQAPNSGVVLPNDQWEEECGDRCNGLVKSFAFKADCTTSTRSFDLNALLEECKSCTNDECLSSCRANVQSPLFSISYQRDGGKQVLNLTTFYKDKSACQGDIQVHTCSLLQVTADIPIVIENGTVSHTDEKLDAKIYDGEMPLDPSLLERFWPMAISSMFPPVSFNATPNADFSKVQSSKCIGSSCTGNGTRNDDNASLFFNDASVIYATGAQSASGGESPLCGLTWTDPMPDMISRMQALALRITLDMATSPVASLPLAPSWTKSVPVTGFRVSTIYNVSPALIAIATVLSIIGVVAVLPLYNGFWEMGRRVSLNPLEIARALGAPILEGLDGNATAEDVVMERGGMGVRYGVVERFGEEKRLRLEEVSRTTVRRPWDGEVFG